MKPYYHPGHEHGPGHGPGHGHGPRPVCNPTIPYKIEETFEFNAKEHTSFGVGMIGSVKFSTVKFARHDSPNIKIEPEIFISNVKVADDVHVGFHINKDSYDFSIRGPRVFHNNGECIKANILIYLPNDLDHLEKFWSHLPVGDIETDFKGKLTLQKLELKLVCGDIKIKDLIVNQINLGTVSGNLHVEGTTGQSVALFATHGHVTTTNIKADHVVGATVDGNVDLTAKNSNKVHAKAVNGNTSIKVLHDESHEANRPHHEINYDSATVNGNTFISLPATFKGRFVIETFNGNTEVVSKNKDVVPHLDKDRRNFKTGHLGDESHPPPTAGSARAATFNGNSKIEFA
ncbi:hypothetical protein K502DRAFT_324982 [Neoconidiobolus thromboides FSU 785]|nr:hypothetical protein K502DRAFT_324982 [Neoconidiobolus thromboides FSU 785]